MTTTRILHHRRRAEAQAYLREALAGFRSLGFRHFRLLGRRNGRDCPACRALDGPLFEVGAPPPFPPPACACPAPGCRLVAAPAKLPPKPIPRAEEAERLPSGAARGSHESCPATALGKPHGVGAREPAGMATLAPDPPAPTVGVFLDQSGHKLWEGRLRLHDDGRGITVDAHQRVEGTLDPVRAARLVLGDGRAFALTDLREVKADGQALSLYTLGPLEA